MLHLKRAAAFLLIAVLLLTLLPAAAAADDENVLISVNYQNAVTYTLTGSSRDITLAVPQRFSSPISLTNGLNITYNTGVYKSVVATPSVDLVPTDGSVTVTLRVTYNHVLDAAGTPKSETDYTVHIQQAARVSPTFSGTISADVQAQSPVPGTVTIPASDFSDRYSPNDGAALGGLVIRGSNPTFGAIKVDNADYTLGSYISAASSITFAAGSTGTVSYDVSAYEGADTATPIGTVVLTILAYTNPRINTPISDMLSKGTVMTFTEAYFASRCTLYGLPLLSVEITPTNTAFGTWTLGATPFTTAKTIPVSQLENLSFTAKAAGTATFNWRAMTKAATPASGTGTFTVSSPVLTLTPFNSGSPIMKGSTRAISLYEFDYTPVTAPLSYVKITTIPASADGYLCLMTSLPKSDTYGYPAIAANTALMTGAVIPAGFLDSLVLVTKSTSTKESVSFKWTATTDSKVSSATWAESVAYTVSFVSAGVLPLYAPYYYATDMNIPLALASDDIISNFLNRTGVPLSYVTFTVPDKSFGTLFLSYDMSKKTGIAVAASTKYYTVKNPNISNITFVPAKDYIGTSELSYNAYTESGVLVTGKIRICVQNSPGGTVSYMTDKNSPIQLDAKDFQAAFLSSTGKTLSAVSFSPPSSNYGKLCYNYSLSGDFDYVVSPSLLHIFESPYLSLVTFKPADDYTGTVPISFTGYTAAGETYTGKLIISVVDSPAGIVRYSVKANSYITLTSGDFSKEFIGVTGSLMSYVTFTAPAATVGSLNYQYAADTLKGTKVTAATKYYDGKSPDISDISFVPAKDFTGICVVPYTAYAVNGTAYAGKLIITVYEGTGVITYNAQSGQPTALNASDFTNAFYMNSGGLALDYVTFELPSYSYGKLYYNYTSPAKFDSVTASGDKYYVTGTPYISNVSFVPQENYTGSFSISYTGYTASGTSFTGKIKFIVSTVNSNSVTYETTSSSPVTFRLSDFTAAFAGKSSNPLYYVRFTLPLDALGTLYYGYSSPTSYSSLVSPSTYYYANYTPALSSVTFVPNPNYSGTLAISYTAVDTSGNAYNGTVIITVKSNDIGTITYKAVMNKPVQFNADDFNTVFLNKTGSTLYSVALTLPSSSVGKLYLGYSATSANPTPVTASTRYYRSFSPLLSDITFVPSHGFFGTVTIPYTAYSAGGSAYYGKIIITFDTTLPFTDIGSSFDWAREAIAYLYRSGVITDTGSGKYYPGVNMTRGDFVMMIASAFNLPDGGDDNFPDVPSGSPYYAAISAAKAAGIIFGNNGRFSPEAALTRQDAMVIIVRALNYIGAPLNAGTINDISGYSDVSQVSDYAISAVATLVRTGLVNGSANKLNPKSMITRAETAVLLYRILMM